ncbi:hypothetical protein M7I_7728 [Glarea lozoyensis 74030]|uniref:Uncharacterized protein n=1 Tax=Glarea lozoyensis (strain ATCC 74030 / MF5533) TaxID=1104152 RepID=H0EY31_GLAL7|nr:hypothetical protein M7I_7728 [Glarea lozoyensis 74030]
MSVAPELDNFQSQAGTVGLLMAWLQKEETEHQYRRDQLSREIRFLVHVSLIKLTELQQLPSTQAFCGPHSAGVTFSLNETTPKFLHPTKGNAMNISAEIPLEPK